MWYKFHPQRFGWEMLPPLLRREPLVSILSVLLHPFRYIYERLMEKRAVDIQRLSVDGRVRSLEDALNAAFSPTDRAIYLTTSEEQRLYLYTRSKDGATLVLRRRTDPQKTALIGRRGENLRKEDFIVHIPRTLEGQLEAIRQLIDRYKQAGRRYRIELF